MKRFANGTYKVRIKEISTGESSIKGTPFVEFVFSNEYRYLSERVYTNGNGWKLLSLIFWKAGLDYRRNSLDDLLGEKLGIEVVSGSYVNQYGICKTYGKLGTIYSIDEIDTVTEVKHRREKVATALNYNNYYDDEYSSNYNSDAETSLAEIYGEDIGDIASAMGKDISEINDSDIRECCGY